MKPHFQSAGQVLAGRPRLVGQPPRCFLNVTFLAA